MTGELEITWSCEHGLCSGYIIAIGWLLRQGWLKAVFLSALVQFQYPV